MEYKFNPKIFFISLVVFLTIFYLLRRCTEGFANFKGQKFRPIKGWHKYIIFDPKVPLNYLEIGSHSGGSVIDFHNEFGRHPHTKLYCIDPWIDHEDYFEYKGQTTKIFEDFKTNIKNAGIEQKVTILRGFSHVKLQELTDDFFDIVYIDGNHEPQFVVEDAVMSFRKLKIGGYMIFDDVGWIGPECTDVGINSFMNGFKNSIKILNKNHGGQAIIKKTAKTNPCLTK